MVIKLKNRIIISSFILFIIGLFMIYSASNIWAEYKLGDSFYYLKREIVFGIIGIILFIIASKINLEVLKKYAIYIFLVCLILLILVLIIGTVRGGAKSWISFGSFLIQPSEFMKIGLIVLLAKIMSIKDLKSLKDLLLPLFFIALVFLFIMLEPDLGSGLVILASAIIMIFVSQIKIKYFIYLGIIGIIGFIILVMVAPYRISRIEAFINPWSDPLGTGFQAIQSLYAISPSGLFGLGYMNSRQKYFYLPEPQTDFIFSIVLEELGIIGGILIIGLFLIIIINGYLLAFKEKDKFKMYLRIGITSIIFIQTFINLGVVTTLLPITGITLPFLSYGGSSIITTFTMIGILVNDCKN